MAMFQNTEEFPEAIFEKYASGYAKGEHVEQYYLDKLSRMVDNDQRIPTYLKIIYKQNYHQYFKSKIRRRGDAR